MSTQITPDTRRFATLLQRGYVGFTRIGTGAQANVYRTQKGNRVLAIKVTKVEDEDDIGEDIQQELTIARNIVHPNCIRVEEMFRSMHRIYQVMPYMANGTIAHIIDKGPLSEWNVIVWFPYIARAIKYLHSCSIAHRDLHANNILLDAHLNPIVSDFGLAKFVESDPANPGQSIQSTQFWSQLCNHHGPELVIGIPYDMLKEDVWSLGVMLFLMINQDYPFDSDAGRVAMAQKQLNRDYRLKPTIEAEVRAELKDLIRQMLEPVQDNRPNIEQVCAHKWMPLITRENELIKK